MGGLTFITLLAYDWKYCFSAIRSYYAIADEIILGLDSDRMTWSKKAFSFDDRAVADFIAGIDKDKKIRIIEGNFHTLDAPLKNDTEERKKLAAARRAGNWVVQIDADEILLNPVEFRKFMDNWKPDACIMASWLAVYKIMGNKALIVGGRPETTPVATLSPQRYQYCRVTDQPNAVSPLRLLHLVLSRTEEEVKQKLTNWGHTKDIDINKTFEAWRTTNLENYGQLKDFHPLHGPLWPCLEVMDWPPRSLVDERVLEHRIDGEKTPERRDSRITIDGRAAGGGMFISFGGGSGGSKGLSV